MKRILFISRFDESKTMNEYLLKMFQVQLCMDRREIIQGMIKLIRPDLILIDLEGMEENAENIFALISSQYCDIPVETIGTTMNKDSLASYYFGDQFHAVGIATDQKLVVEECCKRLNLDMNEVISEAEEQNDYRKHVLLVDDNALLLRNMKSMLGKYYKISVATSCAQAIVVISKKKPDLLILDYDMPVCNGKTTFEMIKNDEETKDIPVIFLTGIADKEVIEDVLRLKPAAYFLKPPVLSALIDAIEDTLLQQETKDK